MHYSKLLALTVSCVILANSMHQAGAVDLSLTARAEAGIDPATRDFIRNLPTDWRPQLAAIVDDTMNRVDASVASYLKSVDALISKKMVELQCTILATEKGVVEDITNRFPWVKRTGPMEQLRNQIASDSARRQYNSSPGFIKAMYNDTMLTTSIVSCQFASVPTAQVDARKITEDFSARWLVWNRAESLGCMTVGGCLNSYKQVLGEIIRASDPRDLVSSGGGTAYAAYKEPDPPSIFGGSSDFSVFEAALSRLYFIENSIGAAQTMREVSAIKQVNAAKKMIDDAKKQIDALKQAAQTPVNMAPVTFTFPCPVAYDRLNSTNKLNPPRTLLSDAQKSLNAAISTASVVKEEVDAQAQLIASQTRRATDAGTFCSA